MARPSSLPKTASTLVLSLLQKEKEPLSAYQILDKLRVKGVKSPPIVYRALDKLLQEGTVHRVEHLNAYMACCHDHKHELSIITVCDNCHKAEELHDGAIIHHVEKLQDMGIELAHNAVLEFPIICSGCGQA